MPKKISRRNVLKGMGAAGASRLVVGSHANGFSAASPTALEAAETSGEILSLTSTSEVLLPTRGRAYMKFSFDFPEPSVSFEDFRFGFRVFTYENVYGLDPSRMKVEEKSGGLELTCSGFTWAGGQQKAAPGKLTA